MEIVLWPHPSLKRATVPVADSGAPFVWGLLEQMYRAMKAAGGIGLAANQVGLRERVLVLDVGAGPEYFINPVQVGASGFRTVSEGCLSTPGLFIKLKRGDAVTVEHQLRDGTRRVESFRGLRAQVLQHEIEHLDGRFYLDHASPDLRDQLRALRRKTGRQ